MRKCIDVYYTIQDNYLCRVYEYEYNEIRHTKSVERIAYIDDERTIAYMKSHPYMEL